MQPHELEAANGQLWSTEQLTGQFIGPPLAGILIAIGIGVPFGVDVAVLAVAAGFGMAHETCTTPQPDAGELWKGAG